MISANKNKNSLWKSAVDPRDKRTDGLNHVHIFNCANSLRSWLGEGGISKTRGNGIEGGLVSWLFSPALASNTDPLSLLAQSHSNGKLHNEMN